MFKTTLLTATVQLTALLSSAVIANALPTRVWISGHGTDTSGCGPVQSPCRTLQYAHDNVAARGEINFLDAAGYGPVNIGKSINIINDGVGTAGVLSNGPNSAIVINAAATDDIVLRGLTIEGANTGFNGIVFAHGGSLVVTNCTIQNFIGGNTPTYGNGILIEGFAGSPSIAIADTTIVNVASVGIFHYALSSVASSPKISIDRVIVSHNYDGIVISNNTTQGGTVAKITNSVSSNNTRYGYSFDSSGSPITVMLDNSSASGNGTGINAEIGARTYLGRSVSTGNTTGLSVEGQFYTYQNNQIDGNSMNIVNTGAYNTVTLH